MEDRARFDVLGEVVDRLGREVPVGRVEGGADDVARDFDRAHGREEQQREDPDGGQEDRRERQQPPRTARVEAAQGDAAGTVDLAEQQPGDEEAGDDEEDVDADVAAGEEREPGVAEQDGDDRRRRAGPRCPVESRSSVCSLDWALASDGGEHLGAESLVAGSAGDTSEPGEGAAEQLRPGALGVVPSLDYPQMHALELDSVLPAHAQGDDPVAAAVHDQQRAKRVAAQRREPEAVRRGGADPFVVVGAVGGERPAPADQVGRWVPSPRRPRPCRRQRAARPASRRRSSRTRRRDPGSGRSASLASRGRRRRRRAGRRAGRRGTRGRSPAATARGRVSDSKNGSPKRKEPPWMSSRCGASECPVPRCGGEEAEDGAGPAG